MRCATRFVVVWERDHPSYGVKFWHQRGGGAQFLDQGCLTRCGFDQERIDDASCSRLMVEDATPTQRAPQVSKFSALK